MAAPRRRVLGIDPGTNVLGYAIVDGWGSERHLVNLGVHRTPRTEFPAEKLRSIFERVTALVVEFKPDECAVESPFFGKNVQSMLKLGRAQGVTMAAAMAQGLTVSEYAPKKIKVSVTGNGNSSKEQVCDMLSATLDFERMDLPLDATDALAAAICHLNQSSLGGIAGQGYGSWKAFLKQNPGRVG